MTHRLLTGLLTSFRRRAVIGLLTLTTAAAGAFGLTTGNTVLAHAQVPTFCIPGTCGGPYSTISYAGHNRLELIGGLVAGVSSQERISVTNYYERCLPEGSCSLLRIEPAVWGGFGVSHDVATQYEACTVNANYYYENISLLRIWDFPTPHPAVVVSQTWVTSRAQWCA